MMELKKTTKFDSKLKNLTISDGEVINEDGEIVDLVKYLEKAYAGRSFDLSTTAKVEELIDIEIDEEDCEEEDLF